MNDNLYNFLILAIIVIVFLWTLQKNKNEHLDTSPLSNEAIQSIASVYNKDNLTATNINATNSLNGYNVNGQYVNAALTINAGVDVNAGKDLNAKGTITGQNINATNLTATTLTGQNVNGQYVNAALTINAGVDINAGKDVNAVNMVRCRTFCIGNTCIDESKLKRL